MKVVHLSYGDGGAGAGRQAHRLHSQLRRNGLDSSMLVVNKTSSDPSVHTTNKGGVGRATTLFSQMKEAYFNKKHVSTIKQGAFSTAKGSIYSIAKHPSIQKADVVILRWINGGMLSPEAIARINKPIIWTLSDTWPFTGGCHYPGDCSAFNSSCKNCPQLRTPTAKDISHKLWKRKLKSYKNLNLHIVAPSRWIYKLAQSSSLFQQHKIHYIPTGVDTKVFYPIDRTVARKALGLPEDKTIIAFGALGATSDPRKGYKHLKKAISILATSSIGSRMHLLAFGNNKKIELDIATTGLGTLQDELSLRLAYSAADIFVAPSIEENLANTCLESLACGTPIAAFPIGGMPDILNCTSSGLLAKKISAQSLADSIVHFVTSDKLKSQNQNRLDKNNSITTQAESYKTLIFNI